MDKKIYIQPNVEVLKYVVKYVMIMSSKKPEDVGAPRHRSEGDVID